MSTVYSNLPAEPNSNTAAKYIANYFSGGVELDSNTFDAVSGFFNSRGFDVVAAKSLATTIILQAKKDNYNPFQILDTMKGLNDVELNALIAEIINYNRFKTSVLGSGVTAVVNSEINRNIVP